jgi:hypothetical protein
MGDPHDVLSECAWLDLSNVKDYRDASSLLGVGSYLV